MSFVAPADPQAQARRRRMWVVSLISLVFGAAVLLTVGVIILGDFYQTFGLIANLPSAPENWAGLVNTIESNSLTAISAESVLIILGAVAIVAGAIFSFRSRDDGSSF